MKKKYIYSLLTILFVAGCACKKDQCVKNNQDNNDYEMLGTVVEVPIGAVSTTTDAARAVSENAGNLTEKFIIISSDTVKQIFVSLEQLRKKSIEQLGTKKVTHEIIGPVIIQCPYCEKGLTISKIPKANTSTKHICPHCSKEFIINWQD